MAPANGASVERPSTINIGCLGMLICYLYFTYRILTPDAPPPFPLILITLPAITGLVLVWAAWSQKAWARWFLLVLFLLPLGLDAHLASTSSGTSVFVIFLGFFTHLGPNLLYILCWAALLLPSSNNWYQRYRSEAN